MNNALHEIYIHRSDNLDLVKCYEDSFEVEQNLRMPYYHFVFYETKGGIRFLSTAGSTEPITRLRKGFQYRLNQLHNPSIEDLCFMFTILKLDFLMNEFDLKIPNPAVREETIPESVQMLVRPTNGYMVYREQGAKFYQLATGCAEEKANEWLAGARIKKREILDQVKDLKIDGHLSTYIFKLFPPNGGLPYLINKPLQEAQRLHEFIQSNPSNYL